MSNKSNQHRPFLIVVSSPSGAGKTTICHKLVQRDHNIGYSISATTRPKRPGEINGRDYFFYSPEEFIRRRNSSEFVETAKVYGSFYGTPVRQVKKIINQGKDVIMDLDIQGMKSIKHRFPDSVAIFIIPSNPTDLLTRLTKRNEPKKEITKRSIYLCAELSAIPKFDYLVYNDDLKTAVADVLTIIRAERLKTKRINNPKTRRN